MENGKISGIRTPKPLNRLSQNLARVITSAISPSKPKFKPIAPAWMSMLVWLTLPFYNFCGFRSVAVNSVYKLQFCTFIFVVLLPVLGRLLIIMPTNTTFFDISIGRLFVILYFSKIEISTAGLVQWASYASSCQMLCRSVKPLPRYRNFNFFECRPLPSWISLNFKYQTVTRA